MAESDIFSLLKDMIVFAEEAAEIFSKELNESAHGHCDEVAYALDWRGNGYYHFYIRGSEPRIIDFVENYLTQRYSLSDIVVHWVV